MIRAAVVLALAGCAAWSGRAGADTGEHWLRGSTHVHAAPSGDSRTPVADVVRWYERHGYDFIVLTDHNRLTPPPPPAPGALIVIPGIELTHNPVGCLPAGDASRQCRIHVNLLGTTAQREGKLEWANRRSNLRVDKYQAALDQQRALGGLAQLNHPTWFWGMTADVLTELARRGFLLVEIANAQFATWNAGDRDHASAEALWDRALATGVTLWGVASDDAHHYDGGGRYPAGGAWVVVRARRDPQAILDALAAGRFYASSGVELARADVDDGALVVELAAGEAAARIAWIENGRRVATTRGRRARRMLPARGYLRAVVTRADGARAWVQPARATR